MTFSWFSVTCILHEFGHALGLLHEHQSVFENKIEWDEEKVYKWAQKNYGWDKETVNEEILVKYTKNLIDLPNSSVYDADSVMLYTYPAELTLNGKGSIGGPRLSSTDAKCLIKAYSPTEDQYKSGLKLKRDVFLRQIYPDMYKPTKENFQINIPNTNFFKVLFYVSTFILFVILFLIGFKYFMKNKKKR
jgi:hypothetical protein